MKTPLLRDIQISTDLQPGDLGYIIYLHGKLYKEECNYGVAFEGYVIASILEFYEKYDPKTNRVWICRHDEKIIGCLVLMNRGEAAQLRYFIIEAAYRGIGLGRKLMNLYMEFLKQCGYKSAYLLTTDELPTAAHLYKSYGFVITDERPTSSSFGKPVIEQRYDLTNVITL
jgi:N-acetylglutamate synthase-like GNAT family acetyltransferase